MTQISPEPAQGQSPIPRGLAERFAAVRETSQQVADLFAPEDQLLQAMTEASPIKWHLAHTSWFFETFILRQTDGYRPLDERYEWLFNSYYNAIGPQPERSERGLWSRPSLSEVASYRAHVDQAVLDALPTLAPDAELLLELGLQHEQQHQELMLTDALAALAKNPLAPSIHSPPNDVRGEASPLTFNAYPRGTFEIGFAGSGFHFDNEAPRHDVLLQPFELACRPLCNAEVIAFIRDGGYERPEFWLSDGFDWVTRNQIAMPCYWSLTGAEYWHYSLYGSLPVDPTLTACHLSYFEADAIARYLGARLPTEAEWEVAAQLEASSSSGHFSADLRWLPRRAEQRNGLQQLLGTVWEWTSTAYCAYPGFRTAPGAVGEYNGKFMHGQQVLRGGSLATPPGHIRLSYRNFFPATARWQYSGVRVARDAN